MQVNGDAQYQCSPEAFVQISTNQEFVRTRFGDLLREAVVTHPSAHAVSVTGQINPEALPGGAAAATKTPIVLEYTEEWTPTSQGGFHASCELRAEAVSVTAHLEQDVIALDWDANQCQWALNGDYRVAIPLIGRMIEAKVSEYFDECFTRDQKLVNTWLKRHAGEYPVAE